MKYKLLLAICVVGWSVWAFNVKRPENGVGNKSSVMLPKKAPQPASVIADQHLASIKRIVNLNHYHNGVCFFINMSFPSGSKRFFIYDLRKDSVINSGLVTHGNCYQYWLEGRKYSNKPGSGCTSLGKYKIGKS